MLSRMIEQDALCPLLPLSEGSSLCSSLNNFIHSLQVAQSRQRSEPELVDVIAQVTVTTAQSPLTEHSVFVLSNTFSPFRQLEESTASERRREMLR